MSVRTATTFGLRAARVAAAARGTRKEPRVESFGTRLMACIARSARAIVDVVRDEDVDSKDETESWRSLSYLPVAGV